MSNPSYPDVPFAPGVPAVLRQVAATGIANSVANVAIGAAQQPANGIISNAQNSITGLINSAFGTPPGALFGDSSDVTSVAMSGVGQWGLFDQDNSQVLVPDSFKSLSYKQDWRIANYPMEQGAFQTYNKVQTPFEVGVVFVKGGSDGDRTGFLNDLDTVANSIDLYNVVTPEYTYLNVSIQHYDYQRTATNGLKLITFDISLLEIRVAPSSSFTNTASASGTDTVNGGIVQPVAATPTQQAQAALVQ